MDSICSANFISAGDRFGEVCPVFQKTFFIQKPVVRAVLQISALGLYEAVWNGSRVGNWLFTPGWTSYRHRLQYQTYDVTELVQEENVLQVMVGKGWCVGNICGPEQKQIWSDVTAAILALDIWYEDGSSQRIVTDQDWLVAPGPVRMSEIYAGETCDTRCEPEDWSPVILLDWDRNTLVPQDGLPVKTQEVLPVVQMLTTPKGEQVLDFGQNLTGFVRFRVEGKMGDVLEIDHAEVLDRDGNFYTDNLRSAKQRITFVCDGTSHTYQPHFTFQGFRYIRINQSPQPIHPADFEAVVVHSDMRRTGYFTCSDPLVNKLYENVIWGQKGNFLDVPTDCPQRDERLGWTGDAQVFVNTAAYNFDVEQFFRKWLRDLRADQWENGGVPHVIPQVLGPQDGASAAWADAAVVCPWQIYLAYGAKDILEEQYPSMVKWVEYIRAQGENEFLWQTGNHFGDWLALDQEGEQYSGYVGATDIGLIATAFYAYSTQLLVKAGRVLGRDMSEYEQLHRNIVQAFQTTYIRDGKPISDTQTAYVLALHFDLVEDKTFYAACLAEKIRNNGNRLNTGFVGTAYLMETLSENGYHELAYTLLLQEEFPSWLYSVKRGATTIWEHWDGIRPDGTMWDTAMNSFNHYAYGAVASWMYGRMAGIRPFEEAPGYRHILLEPIPDKRIPFVQAKLETRNGLVISQWEYQPDGKIQYFFRIPERSTATIRLNGETYEVNGGEYRYLVD